MRPTLLLIHGLPASGKTTLAKWLAWQLGWPIFHKDDVKEILFDTVGWKDREWSRHLGGATIEILFYAMAAQLNAKVSCIIESNFKPELASPRVNEILTQAGARCIQVVCHADGLTRLKRFQARLRHPGHDDVGVTDAFAPQWQAETLLPLSVPGPLVEVDTTDLARVDYEAVLREIREHLGT